MLNSWSLVIKETTFVKLSTPISDINPRDF